MNMSVGQPWLRKVTKHGPGNGHNIVRKWSGNVGQKNDPTKWSGKCSPDFEGEFIEMFPTDRLSIFDGIWAVPRHIFFDVSEQMFERLLLRNFSR